MTADRAQIEALLERVKAATGPDRELDGDLWECLTGELVTMMPLSGPVLHNGARAANLTASIDAVVALVEHVLPGWAYACIKERLRGRIAYVHNNASAFVGVAAAPNPDRHWHECRAATPPLALLAALLTAFLAQEPAHDR